MNKMHNDDFDLIQQEKEAKKEKLKGILFLIWFVITIILMLVFSYLEHGALVVCLFGHYIAIFGFIAYHAEGARKRIEEVWPAYLFMFIGSALMLGSLLYHFEIITFP